jgi:hypothetical protein
MWIAYIRQAESHERVYHITCNAATQTAAVLVLAEIQILIFRRVLFQDVSFWKNDGESEDEVYFRNGPEDNCSRFHTLRGGDELLNSHQVSSQSPEQNRAGTRSNFVDEAILMDLARPHFHWCARSWTEKITGAIRDMTLMQTITCVLKAQHEERTWKCELKSRSYHVIRDTRWNHELSNMDYRHQSRQQ